MRFDNLPQWLQWQETLHFTEVDPGLERVGKVWQQLRSDKPLAFKIVTVAGTNGKGSSVAMLDSILRAAGYKTGCYTSPHLLNYNERICVDGLPCDDELICAAFEQIDQARGGISLTYFEFATLAAMLIFAQQQIDIALLEVGMGGRLDAVNLFDADITLITPIGLDHTLWLGDNIETIAAEKAGVMRANKPVVCSEATPAKSIVTQAQKLNSPLYCAENDFTATKAASSWHWQNDEHDWSDLKLPALKGAYQIDNAAAVLQVISLLKKQGFAISKADIDHGLEHVRLAGRFEVIKGEIDHIFDVTHNEQGATSLASTLSETACSGRTLAVLAMLKDKDPQAIAAALEDKVDGWYLAGLTGNRGMAVDLLAAAMNGKIAKEKINQKQTVKLAYQQSLLDAQSGDRILVFGSFHTVEAVMRLL